MASTIALMYKLNNDGHAAAFAVDTPWRPVPPGILAKIWAAIGSDAPSVMLMFPGGGYPVKYMIPTSADINEYMILKHHTMGYADMHLRPVKSGQFDMVFRGDDSVILFRADNDVHLPNDLWYTFDTIELMNMKQLKENLKSTFALDEVVIKMPQCSGTPLPSNRLSISSMRKFVRIQEAKKAKPALVGKAKSAPKKAKAKAVPKAKSVMKKPAKSF